jgi:hypothetical protein
VVDLGRRLLGTDAEIYGVAPENMDGPKCTYVGAKELYYCCDFGSNGCFISPQGKRVTGDERVSMVERAKPRENGAVFSMKHEYEGCEIEKRTKSVECKAMVRGIAFESNYDKKGVLKRMCFDRDEGCVDYNVGCTKFATNLFTAEIHNRWICCDVQSTGNVSCEIFLAHTDNR